MIWPGELILIWLSVSFPKLWTIPFILLFNNSDMFTNIPGGKNLVTSKQELIFFSLLWKEKDHLSSLSSQYCLNSKPD